MYSCISGAPRFQHLGHISPALGGNLLTRIIRNGYLGLMCTSRLGMRADPVRQDALEDWRRHKSDRLALGCDTQRIQ